MFRLCLVAPAREHGPEARFLWRADGRQYTSWGSRAVTCLFFGLCRKRTRACGPFLLSAGRTVVSRLWRCWLGGSTSGAGRTLGLDLRPEVGARLPTHFPSFFFGREVRSPGRRRGPTARFLLLEKRSFLEFTASGVGGRCYTVFRSEWGSLAPTGGPERVEHVLL